VGRDVLLVDDILDTAEPLPRAWQTSRSQASADQNVCFAEQSRSAGRERRGGLIIGFEIPDFFVVGYGLDFAERYRNLPVSLGGPARGDLQRRMQKNQRRALAQKALQAQTLIFRGGEDSDTGHDFFLFLVQGPHGLLEHYREGHLRNHSWGTLR